MDKKIKSKSLFSGHNYLMCVFGMFSKHRHTLCRLSALYFDSILLQVFISFRFFFVLHFLFLQQRSGSMSAQITFYLFQQTITWWRACVTIMLNRTKSAKTKKKNNFDVNSLLVVMMMMKNFDIRDWRLAVFFF